jgi:hypothetical protein
MMENEALQVIQKMNVKINGTEDEVKKFHEAMEVAKRALKKGIEVHPLGALHDVKKGTLYTCSNCGTRLGWGQMQRDWRIIVMDAAKNRLEGGHPRE